VLRVRGVLADGRGRLVRDTVVSVETERAGAALAERLRAQLEVARDPAGVPA
jgi:hypothetical protein